MPSTFFKSRTKQAKNNPSGVRRVFTLNIGTIVFGLLFIYILISILLYVTATHVRSFQVTAGPLARNAEYTGIAVYTEHVVSADASGYVDYYAGDHAKVKRGGVVYGISPVKNEHINPLASKRIASAALARNTAHGRPIRNSSAPHVRTYAS